MMKDMNNKKIVLVLVALVIASATILFSLGNAVASTAISNTYEMEGIGEIKRSIDIETSADIGSGQKFSETMYTILRGTSQINLTQDIEAVMSCNSTDISVYGTLAGTETRAQQCLRNYDIGSIHEYRYNGASNLKYEYSADNYSAMMHIEGETLNVMQYAIKLKEVGTHKTIFEESFAMDGYVKYDVESFMENVSYPASGEEGDWLECP